MKTNVHMNEKEDKMKYCSGCGAPLKDSDLFCTNCGKKVDAVPTDAETNLEQNLPGQGTNPEANQPGRQTVPELSGQQTVSPTTQAGQQTVSPAGHRKNRSDKTGSMVVPIVAISVVAIAFASAHIAWLAILLAIAGFVVSIVGSNKKFRLNGLAVAGIPLSIAAIIFTIVVGVIDMREESRLKYSAYAEQQTTTYRIEKSTTAKETEAVEEASAISEDTPDSEEMTGPEGMPDSEEMSASEEMSDSDVVSDSGKMPEEDTLRESEETSQPETTSEPETDSDTVMTEFGPVNRNLKEFLDSYEEFIDKYCEFMEKYSDSGSSLSMLYDYLEYMEDYEEMMEKLDEWDEDEMTFAESAYYLDVITRCSRKMLQITYD